jgi:hypothetical protein
MIPQTGTILCVEVPADRCAALTQAGYTAMSVAPREAIALLRERVFDIVVTVGLSVKELSQLCDVSHQAAVLNVNASTPATLLLFLVDQRLRELGIQISRTIL